MPNNAYHQGGPLSVPNNAYHQGGPLSVPNNAYHQGGPLSVPNNAYHKGDFVWRHYRHQLLPLCIEGLVRDAQQSPTSGPGLGLLQAHAARTRQLTDAFRQQKLGDLLLFEQAVLAKLCRDVACSYETVQAKRRLGDYTKIPLFNYVEYQGNASVIKAKNDVHFLELLEMVKNQDIALNKVRRLILFYFAVNWMKITYRQLDLILKTICQISHITREEQVNILKYLVRHMERICRFEFLAMKNVLSSEVTLESLTEVFIKTTKDIFNQLKHSKIPNDMKKNDIEEHHLFPFNSSIKRSKYCKGNGVIPEESIVAIIEYKHSVIAPHRVYTNNQVQSIYADNTKDQSDEGTKQISMAGYQPSLYRVLTSFIDKTLS